MVQLNYKQREMGRQKANYYANGSLPLGSLFIVIFYIAALGIYRIRVLVDPVCYKYISCSLRILLVITVYNIVIVILNIVNITFRRIGGMEWLEKNVRSDLRLASTS